VVRNPGIEPGTSCSQSRRVTLRIARPTQRNMRRPGIQLPSTLEFSMFSTAGHAEVTHGR